MLNRGRSMSPDSPEPPTAIKTLHETIMAKLGEQLRKQYEPPQQFPPEMLALVGRLHEGLED
jgi:hypothetical protein